MAVAENIPTLFRRTEHGWRKKNLSFKKSPVGVCEIIRVV